MDRYDIALGKKPSLTLIEKIRLEEDKMFFSLAQRVADGVEESCPDCNGTGYFENATHPCLTCGGKGVLLWHLALRKLNG